MNIRTLHTERRSTRYLFSKPLRAGFCTAQRLSALLLGLLLMGGMAWGQAAGDYRSRQNGNWNDGCTWERYNGTNWVPQCAFPEVAATASSTKTVIAGATHTVSLPAGIQSGDLLLVFWSDANDLNTAPGTPSGWTQLYTSTAGNRIRRAWYKVADGTEGTTLNITAGAERSAHNAYRIAAGTYQGTPVAATAATGDSNSANPPDLTSGFGNVNTLWIASAHSVGDGNPVGAPDNYGNQLSGYSGATGNAHARMVTARREFQSASQNPTSFGNYSTDRQWAANTIAIRSATTSGTPNSASGAITIRSPHTVTIAAAVTVDQVLVDAGATLVVDQTLTIANGAGTDLEVNGTLYHGAITGSGAGAFTINAGATIAFNNGAEYYLTRTGGRSVPTATWAPNSTCFIRNWASSGEIPGNLLGQTFGHFQIGPLLDGGSNFGNLVTGSGTGTITVAGNFTLLNGSPATRPIGLSNSTGAVTLSIGGNFIMPAGTFRLKNAEGSATLNVGGNFLKTGGTFNMRTANALGTATVNVTGNFTNSAGTFNMSGVAAVGTLNVGGNFSITGGTITESSSGSGAINFNGAGTPQVYTSGGTVTNLINFTVNSGAVVHLPLGNTIGGSGAMTINGKLTGAGTVALNTTNNGVISPGSSLGTLIINGNLVFGMGSVLEVELTGTPINNDLLAITGNVNFTNGVLNASLLSGTVFTSNQFPVVTYLSRLGTSFSAINFPSAMADWNSEYNPGSLILYYEGLSPLPIELLFFRGEKIQNTALLTWRTATERNNDYMAIERSADGRHWEELGRVPGAGTTTVPKSYSFTDEKPLPGINYYRLRQVDYDGTATYHDVIALEFDHSSSLNPRLFPNPAREHITLRLSQAMPRDSDALLLDSRGRALQRRTLPSGATQWEFDLGGLPAGMYFLRISSGREQEVLRFVKE